MIRRRLRWAAAAGIALAAAAWALGDAARAAERVELHDGRTLVGEISQLDDGSVAVHTADGTEIIPRARIARIVPVASAADEKEGRASAPTLAEVVRDSATSTDAQGRRVPRRYRDEEIRQLREQLAEIAAEDPVAEAMQRAVQDLESNDPEGRVAAMARIREGWPRTEPTLRVVLALGNDQARVDATRLLRDPALGDTSALCARAVRDRSASVRMHALRAIREKQIRSFAPLALEILTGNSPWTLRQEAARALERIGEPQMLTAVVHVWERESEAGRKRRLRRLLRSLNGSDLGDDPEAWLEAGRRHERRDAPGRDAGTGPPGPAADDENE